MRNNVLLFLLFVRSFDDVDSESFFDVFDVWVAGLVLVDLSVVVRSVVEFEFVSAALAAAFCSSKQARVLHFSTGSTGIIGSGVVVITDASSQTKSLHV